MCLMPRHTAMIFAASSAPCGVVSAFIIRSSPNLSFVVLGFTGMNDPHAHSQNESINTKPRTVPPAGVFAFYLSVWARHLAISFRASLSPRQIQRAV
ncbi:hypothetical protein, partial [Escherichia coli]|uniref:hypothetical protein n=2 Tax=Escherichia coli TaxID=562 RepID=UPI001BC9D33D